MIDARYYVMWFTATIDGDSTYRNDLMRFGKNALNDTKIVIPTYNAEKHLDSLLAGLSKQGLSNDQILVIDSSSTDRTVERFRSFGAQIHVIPQSEFNHGGTRRLAAELSREKGFLIYMTQDAIPASELSFINLLEAFEEERVGMAYGRQLPRPAAGPIEMHARLFNYPPESITVCFADKQQIGSKVVFASNSFAAYRSSALAAIGGFPQNAFFGEDQIVAAKMLKTGFSKAYVANAQVFHSHLYTPKEEFKRYFDVGVFHAHCAWLTSEFGNSEGEGKRFVLSEIQYLLRTRTFLVPEAIARTLLKYTAYRAGRFESKLPTCIKRKLSASPHYWNKR